MTAWRDSNKAEYWPSSSDLTKRGPDGSELDEHFQKRIITIKIATHEKRSKN